MPKTIIAKNTTASGISIGDLSGATIIASGTRNLSEQFEFSRIANALDLIDYITNSGIVIDDGMGDLPVAEALRYISYDDATSVQNIPIVDPGDANLQDGFAIRYDEGQFSFDFDTFSVLELANFYAEDGSYYITNASGIKIRLSQNFIDLDDSPSSYYNNENGILTVNSSGTGLIFKKHEDIEIFGSYNHHVSYDATEYTTSLNYITRVTLTASGLPLGEYRVGWYYEYNYPTSSFAMYTRVIMDDTDVLNEVAHRVSNANDWYSSSGFAFVDLTSSGTYHIDLDYRSSKAGTDAGIRRTRLEFWRIF